MTNDKIIAQLDAVHTRLEVLEAREAIRDVLHRYARGADRCDLTLFKSCYWADATDCHWFWNGNAHAFADWVIPVLRELPNSQHSITNAIIDLAEGGRADQAFVECQWYVLHRIPNGDGQLIDQQTEGRYLDLFERRQNEWKILHRQVAIEAMREFVTPDLLAGFPATHPARAQRAPNDALYRRAAIAHDELHRAPPMQLWDDARSRHR